MEYVIFVCASRICGVHRLARKNLLGGWQISGNYWYASGTPVQIVGDWTPPGFQQRFEPSHPKFGVKLSFRRLRRRIDAGGLNRSTVTGLTLTFERIRSRNRLSGPIRRH
jgi:hypothetical protein